jgi:hypothetical protein
MLALKAKVLVICTLVFVLLLSVENSYAADLTSNSFKRGPGGGGGGTQLTQPEIDSLLYMREEEKLARDSYLTLYDKWGLQIFSNIASSEMIHMSKIKDLLDRYGLPDPAAGHPVGAFTNPVLQQLYDDLMVQGSQSPTEALKVGVTIEEVDIQDLQHYLSLTNRTDITQVYTKLMNASYNHLSAFNNQLGQ